MLKTRFKRSRMVGNFIHNFAWKRLFCWSFILVYFVGVVVVYATPSQKPSREAPRGRPWPASWASGNKQFFGTSYEMYESYSSFQTRTGPMSRLWFTGAQGVLSEIYWPTLDRKQIRDLQFLVSDAQGFFVEERTQTQSQVEWLKQGVPAFLVRTWDEARNFEIEKVIFSDPSRDVLLIKVRFRPYRRGLTLTLLLNPALGNTPYGDSAEVNLEPFQKMWAWQGSDALALVSSLSFSKLSVGYSGTADPFQDVRSHGRLTQSYREAWDGNVVLAGELPLKVNGDTEFSLALGFANRPHLAHEKALEALNFIEESQALYVAQWQNYQDRIYAPQNLSSDEMDLYRASVAVLKSLEDKSFPGAFIASPSVPWGLIKVDNSRETSPQRTQMTRAEVPEAEAAKGMGGYHLVWPRDLYQMAESFIALGDLDTARASLRYLEEIQYREGEGYWDYGPGRRFPKAGSFLQNSWVHGEAHWKMLQIDQTAYPILLALSLRRLNAVTPQEIRRLVFSAADFLERYGPWTFQERWEENMGVAPSTLAVQIAALREAATLAAELKDLNRQMLYLKKAEELDASIEKWTFTETGTKGNGRYYLRIVGTNTPLDDWNPNSNRLLPITNGASPLLEKAVLDGGFLELVRLGVRKASDFFVRETLEEYDLDLRVQTSRGVGFYRYSGDFYNWDEDTGAQTRGMLWPFLSGERARYEMQLLYEKRVSQGLVPDPRQLDVRVGSYLRAFTAFATPSKMLPEQVWASGLRAGTPTGAATPLGWAHGEYVRLLREREEFVKSVQIQKASLQ